MPFTFSHPFIVLPFCRTKYRYFSATGLITGSMALDFEYFFYMKKIEHESFHTVAGGVFIFGVPMALLITFMYHLLIRDKLIDNLPNTLWLRMAPFKTLNWLQYFRENFFILLCSILAGIYSHLLLDALTHDFGFFVQWIPLLQKNISIAGKSMAFYSFLQGTLSLVGGLLIVYAVMNLEKDYTLVRPTAHSRIGYWAKLAIVFLIIMAIRFVADTAHNKPVDILIAGIASGILSLIIVSIPAARKVFKQV
jgi:Domain of unknown function (DUF4184)